MEEQCQTFIGTNDDYKTLISISDLKDAQPDGYLIRFSFYILGEREANIVFTQSLDPYWNYDDVYEISKIFIFFHELKIEIRFK